ncbi:TPR repeat-containing protein T20B12.1, partial [Toxocara canis]
FFEVCDCIQSSYNEKRGRTALVLASGLLPSWRVHTLHAQILRSLGCTAEALRIYEKQEAWDDVIECYKSLGQLEKAEHLVRKLIENNPTDPLYYCMLGDITLEPNYYEQAKEV